MSPTRTIAINRCKSLQLEKDKILLLDKQAELKAKIVEMAKILDVQAKRIALLKEYAMCGACGSKTNLYLLRENERVIT